jgi:hypothetical protein
VLKLGLLLLAGLARQRQSRLPCHNEHIRNRCPLAKHVGGFRGRNLPGGVAADRRVNRLVHGFCGLIKVRTEVGFAVGAILISYDESALPII